LVVFGLRQVVGKSSGALGAGRAGRAGKAGKIGKQKDQEHFRS